MDIETSNDPDAFSEFEHDGWQQVSKGYERHFAGLKRGHMTPPMPKPGDRAPHPAVRTKTSRPRPLTAYERGFPEGVQVASDRRQAGGDGAPGPMPSLRQS